MQGTKIEGLWERCTVVVLCIAFGTIGLIGVRTTRDSEARGLRPHQLVHAINVASAAKGGNIADVDVKREARHTFVDVAILAADGHKYAVRVEGNTGKVVSVALHPDRQSAETTSRSRDKHRSEGSV